MARLLETHNALIHICGRKVKVQTGTKSQTVNICDDRNIHSQYDYVIRVQPPAITEDTLLQRSFQSIEDLVCYLERQYFGRVERTPVTRISQPEQNAEQNKGRGISTLPAPIVDAASAWEQSAKLAVEKSIDQLVLEFVEFPYLHRVEHSIHCELFRILTAHKIFSRTYPMGRWMSQSVHKEWPEFLARPENGARRGNFDIAVLSPDRVRTSSFADFRQGRIKPCVAIEVGLDYSLRDHLSLDFAKLENSGIANSYLIHLVRQDCYDDFDALEQYVTDCKIKTAYARVTDAKAFYKLVNEERIRVVENLPAQAI